MSETLPTADRPADSPVDTPVRGTDDEAADPSDAGGGADEAPSPAGLVAEILQDGPVSVSAIAHRFEEAWPDFLSRRAGLLHPLLLRMTAEGRAAPTSIPGPAGARVAYALTSANGRDPAPGRVSGDMSFALDGMPATSARSIRRVAERAASGLAHSPPLAARMGREVAEHLADSVAARMHGGEPEKDALKAAVKDFGDAYRVRTDLRRVASGRRAYLFPQSLVESLKGSLAHDAWILLLIFGVIVFVRLQVLSAYHIPTRSMEPTLHGDKRDGDRILVNRLTKTPKRGEIVVFDGWGTERKNYVKRCMGLPGDRLRIREGDIYLSGRLMRKRDRFYEEMLFPWWTLRGEWRRARTDAEDDQELAIEEFRDRLTDLFTSATGRWLLHTDGTFEGTPTEGDSGRGEGILRLIEPVDDRTYDELTGEDRDGFPEVPDARFSLTVRPVDADSKITVRLARGSVWVDAILSASDGSIELRVDDEQVFRIEGRIKPGEDYDVRLAYVDRIIRLDVDDVHAESEQPQPEYPRRQAPSGNFEVRITGGGARARITRIERDVHWTSDYDDDEWVLGPDDFFMLGDNSSNSQDSREKQAVHRSRLVGKPVMIVWPPKRVRLIRSRGADDTGE